MRHLRTSSYQLVPARTSLNQLVNTVYPYNCRVRTFGWYRIGTLVRTRKVLVRDFKHPYRSVDVDDARLDRMNDE